MIGLFAFFSTITRMKSATSATAAAAINAVEDHPMFCPKDGMHRNKLKNTTTRAAPGLSNPAMLFFSNAVFLMENAQIMNTATHRATHTHIMTLHPAAFMIRPPQVGPTTTAPLEISI